MSGAGAPFTNAQKEYLEGYAAGLRVRDLVPFVGVQADGRLTHQPNGNGANLAGPAADGATAFGVPIDELTREERFKLEENPLDIWDKILRHAAANKPPEGGDVFRFKFHGLFYVAPAQDSFMCRVRMPGNVLTSHKMRALARISREWGGGYADVTTRGNIQIREFQPRDIVNVLMALADAGLTSRGAGADNVRNVTATPTSGLDPAELYDVRPLALGLQFYLNNNRDLFGLPRKFNVAFDSGGSVSVVGDTNDIGFQAVRVGDGKDVAPGVYFRVLLGGITGHRHFAEDAGIVVPPEECVAVAAAMIRVFADQGDRTDRKKARLRFLLDRIGMAAFLDATEAKLAFKLRRLKAEDSAPGRVPIRHGHVGAFSQKQPGLTYVGVAILVGRMTVAQMDRLADLADDCGTGELRLTVWQNVIVPNIPDGALAAVERRVKAMGFDIRAASASAGLVACTGNTGCKFAMSDTKGHAFAIRRALDKSVSIDTPINIHLTGCPNSCAQHYIGDIGLLGVQVPTEGGASIEGYNIILGGASGRDRVLGRDIAKGLPADEVPAALARLLNAYAAARKAGEGFVAFTRRHDEAALRAMLTGAAP
jgi:ferredoxin-nitrite reductase